MFVIFSQAKASPPSPLLSSAGPRRANLLEACKRRFWRSPRGGCFVLARMMRHSGWRLPGAWGQEEKLRRPCGVGWTACRSSPRRHPRRGEARRGEGQLTCTRGLTEAEAAWGNAAPLGGAESAAAPFGCPLPPASASSPRQHRPLAPPGALDGAWPKHRLRLLLGRASPPPPSGTAREVFWGQPGGLGPVALSHSRLQCGGDNKPCLPYRGGVKRTPTWHP